MPRSTKHDALFLEHYRAGMTDLLARLKRIRGFLRERGFLKPAALACDWCAEEVRCQDRARGGVSVCWCWKKGLL